jgi:capsular polysaccharide biosynthesis protein
MELRAYVAVLRRRWWLPALLVGLTLALTVLGQRPWQPRPPVYALGLSFSVGVQPQAGAGEYNYDGYYSALASEYLIDDFSEIVKGSAFAAEVSRRLVEQGITVAPGSIQGSTQAGKLHRILTLTLYGGDPAQLSAIADAVSGAMTEAAHLFMPRLLAEQGAVYLVNRGQPAVIGPSLRQRLDLPLRLALALVAGVLVIFLLEYLDDRLRDRRQLEALGIPVLAEIPRR